MKFQKLLPILALMIVAGCHSGEKCPGIQDWELQKIDQATLLGKQMSYDSSLLIYNALLDTNPDNFIAYSSRAVILYQKIKHNPELVEKYRDSILNDLDTAIQLCPDFPNAYKNSIRLGYDLRDFTRVIDHSNKYRDKNFEPNSELSCLLADAYFEKGDPNKGVEYATEALAIKPVFRFSYIIRSKCYLQLGKNELALNDAETYIAEDKQSPLAYNILGNSLYALNRHNESFNCFKKAFELDSTTVENLAGMGLVLIEQSQKEKGCSMLIQAYELSKTVPKPKRVTDYVVQSIKQHCK